MSDSTPVEEVPPLWFRLAGEVARSNSFKLTARKLADYSETDALNQKGFVSNFSACLMQEAPRLAYALGRSRKLQTQWSAFQRPYRTTSMHLGAGVIRSLAVEVMESLQGFSYSELSAFGYAVSLRVHEYRRRGMENGKPYFARELPNFRKNRLPLDISSVALARYNPDIPVCVEEAICNLHYVEQPLYHALHGNPAEAYGLLKATATDPHEFPNFAHTKGHCGLLAVRIALRHKLGEIHTEPQDLQRLLKISERYLLEAKAQTQKEGIGPTLLIENCLHIKLPETKASLETDLPINPA